MWWTSYLATDIGNTDIITNLVTGIACLVIAVFFRFSSLVRLEYRTPIAILISGLAAQKLSTLLNVPLLMHVSIDTMVTMIAVAIAVVLVRYMR